MAINRAVMSIDDIKALPVADVAAKDCLLFMWTVSHLQAEAFDVARAWGFQPVSVAFIWDKARVGMGYWTRQEAEICHLFKRGKPRRLSRGGPADHPCAASRAQPQAGRAVWAHSGFGGWPIP